jgi:signal transduction histidine kinase
VPARFDPDQMQQVLINLLKNARESGSPSDQVQLEVVRDHEVVISVLDRGPGMKPEDLARAAEPFFTTKPEGTGLGLHLCREVAEAHGGKLEILPRLGGGMAIHVHLPS